MNTEALVEEKVKVNKRRDVYKDLDPEVKIRTKKMLMYLIIFAVVMIFAGFTSGYIVINANKYWVHVDAPDAFWMSNVLIVLSSLTMYGAYKMSRAGKLQVTSVLLIVTFFLGLGFTFSQINGWKALSEMGMGFSFTEVDGVIISNQNRLGQITGEYGTDYYIHKDGERLLLEDGEFYMSSDTFRDNPVTIDVENTSNMNSSFITVLVYMHIAHLAIGLLYLVVLTVRSIKQIINRDSSISLYAGGLYWHFLGILWIFLFTFLFFIH